MRLKKLLEKIIRDKGGSFFPEDIESYVKDFFPDILCKSETLQIACGVSDDEMEALYGEAYRLYDEGHYTESADAFRWLVFFNPFLHKYWMGLGASQQLIERFEEALHSYAVAAILDILSPYPHYYAYDCYMALENHKDAALALESAAEKARYDLKYATLKNEIAALQRGLTSCTSR